MKIGFTGIDLQEGKIKYNDENLIALEKKDNPKKVSPFFAEFIRNEYIQTEVIIAQKNKILDLLIPDIEKIENRLARITDNTEKELMTKSLEFLEKETPLCDAQINEKEKEFLKSAALISIKPIVKVEGNEDINTIIAMALEKANYMFFYTAGPKEVHAWLVKRASDIVTCAGKIHTDLARGFIKGDVVTFDDYMKCHNFNECKSKGLAKLVDRDYIVQPAEIIEIRFNV